MTNNGSDSSQVRFLIIKIFYSIGDYYKKCSRTKFELIQNSSIWFISIIKNQRTLKLEQILRAVAIQLNTFIL